ncbi:putative calcium-binding mitochondrial carrier K02F3.2, partial [Trichinella pseudospiralis]
LIKICLCFITFNPDYLRYCKRLLEQTGGEMEGGDSWSVFLRLAHARASPLDLVFDISLFSDRLLPATTDQLKSTFSHFASAECNGSQFMTAEDFVCKFLSLPVDAKLHSATVKLLARAADKDKDGLISFEDFSQFESMLRSPDALYLISFEMFKSSNTQPSQISFQDFQDVVSLTESGKLYPLQSDSDFIVRYFGKDRRRQIGYLDFCELLHDFHKEQALAAFRHYDKDSCGRINVDQFCQIMFTAKRHLLNNFMMENLREFCVRENVSYVSYPYFAAFNGLLEKMELMKRIYLNVSKGNLQTAVTKEDFLHYAQPHAQVTPLEVDILFKLCKLAHADRCVVKFEDFEHIDPDHLKRVSYIKRLMNIQAVNNPADRDAFIVALENVYRFSLGSIAGACGATVVYPIDLVKTRMQNQRTAIALGEVMYRNSWDCFRKVIHHEGILGLYRGLTPQLMGVAPEKAIKLTVNDFVRDKFTHDGNIPLWAEVIAGGCGGASQVMFTNPVEIVKIRLQVAGEVRNGSGSRVGLGSVLRDLGLPGLYKGASACFLRDIPFSAIYFPLYAHAKRWFADDDGHNNAWSLFCSAFIAGVPAAGLCTPPDVIKTRLQVAARTGQSTYTGIVDCFKKVLREEGWRAFWKGSAARVFRSSPQFGVTLLVYELLQRTLYVDFGGTRPTGSEVPAVATRYDHPEVENPYHFGGYRLARATFSGIETKFGLYFPKFSASTN